MNQNIKKIITSRRKKTNCFSFYNEIEQWLSNSQADAFLIEDNVFIFLNTNGFYKFYYYVTELTDIKHAQILLDTYRKKSNISLEFTTKNRKNLDQIKEVIHNLNFTFYAEFARLLSGTNILRSEKKEEEDHHYFEYASMQDKKELLEIMHNEFDVITDNIPTDEELSFLIQNKSIALKHLDNEIIYIQIYSYTKGALYSRMTWIKKKYRKPKYTIDIYKGIDKYIKQLNIKDYKNLRCYFWVNTNIKNYKINLKQGAKIDGITCSIFTYKKDIES